MAWTVDQTQIGTAVNEISFGDNSISMTTNVTVASNAWIFLFMASSFSAQVNSVTGGSLTWSRSNVFGASPMCIARAWAPSGLASGATLTAGWDSTDVDHKWIAGCSFLGGDANSFDLAGSANNATSSAWATNNLTTTAANDLVIGHGYIGTSGNTLTPTAPTVKMFQTTGSATAIFVCYKLAGSPGAYNLAGSLSFSDAWDSFCIAMQPASVVSPPLPKISLPTMGASW